jgi:hypothetical protein
LSEIQASRSEDEWTGNGNTESDGKLLLNLEHEGEQMHIVTSLTGQPATNAIPATPPAEPPAAAFGKLKF